MLRAPIVFAALIGSGSAQGYEACDDCNVDLTALEEFTADYNLVMGTLAGPNALNTEAAEPSDHGTVAVHARNLQLKLDNHFEIPADFHPPVPNPVAQGILAQLAGHEIHEELHINGVHGQASFHLASPILNACIQVDVPAPPIDHDMMEMQLQQAQQLATMLVHQQGHHVTVDGEQGVGIRFPDGQAFVVTDDSHPELVTLSPEVPLALKFSNYANSVGNAFAVRACEVEAQSATKTMLAANPDVREYIGQRIAEHQSRLQALLEPTFLNTRYNFVPLQVAELMMASVHEGCTNDVLTETAPASSTFQALVGACSFVMGVAATYGAMRKKAKPSADAYYQVSA